MKIVLTFLLPVIFAGSIFSQTTELMFTLPSCPTRISQSNAKEHFIVNCDQNLQELKIEILQTEYVNKSFSVSIVNTYGIAVYSKKHCNNNTIISTKDLSAGVYAIIIKYGDKMFVYKILKF
ncbi:MAG: T9SS type A sorting domain-containing protein [Clostridia bacterium]|nr:T9SS type A sorting domain-containing protein [Clostridia bacterium]